MVTSKWNRLELEQLYIKEGKTLAEIGALKGGVSRERIRQVMESLGIPRCHNQSLHPRKKPPPRFNDLTDYLNRGKDCRSTLRLYLPKQVCCTDCGNKNKPLEIHHLHYPASCQNDIQLVCRSCHTIKHRKGITYQKQLDIVFRYEHGAKARALAVEYHVSMGLIDKIVAKLRNNLTTLRS